MPGKHIRETFENYLSFLLMNQSMNQVFLEQLICH